MILLCCMGIAGADGKDLGKADFEGGEKKREEHSKVTEAACSFCRPLPFMLEKLILIFLQYFHHAAIRKIPICCQHNLICWKNDTYRNINMIFILSADLEITRYFNV